MQDGQTQIEVPEKPAVALSRDNYVRLAEWAALDMRSMAGMLNWLIEQEARRREQQECKEG